VDNCPRAGTNPQRRRGLGASRRTGEKSADCLVKVDLIHQNNKHRWMQVPKLKVLVEAGAVRAAKALP
jgi:hypothetical protein